MLISFAAYILSIMNYNYFDNKIVERMFRMKPKPDPDLSSKEAEAADKPKKPPAPVRMNATLFQNLKEYWRSWLPDHILQLNRFRQNHQDQSFEIGRQILERESNMLSIIH